MEYVGEKDVVGGRTKNKVKLTEDEKRQFDNISYVHGFDHNTVYAVHVPRMCQPNGLQLRYGCSYFLSI